MDKAMADNMDAILRLPLLRQRHQDEKVVNEILHEMNNIMNLR